jgi:carbon-monoxide dehydrogenase large subunit
MTQSPTARDDDVWKGRVEDDALLRGAGRFGDDVKPDGTLAAYFVRSPHAFAKIARIDVSAAKGAVGVVAVFTATDLNDAHYHSISHGHPIPGRGGKTAVSPHRPSLAETRVMHVGEPVAMVVAESAAAAQDAADKVIVDYEELTPVTDARRLSVPSRKRPMWCASSSSISG